MPFSLGDIIQTKLVATYQGQEIQNLLTYNIVTFGLSADVDTILDTLENFLLPLFVEIQLEGLNWNLIRIDNLTDGLSFAERTVDISGVHITAASPSFVAGGFIKHVGSKLTRPGSMRMGGIPRLHIVDNAWLPSAPDIAALEVALGSELSNALPPPDDIEIDPVVVRRTNDVPPFTFHVNPVTTFTHKPLITSQNSRKQG